MMTANTPIKLYRHPLSGNAHRVELFLSVLGLDCTLIDVDLAGGAQKEPEFLALNPRGQVPVIEDNGVMVSESNAILIYLATQYGGESWLPTSAKASADVQRWLSIVAGDIAFGPAAARLVKVFGAKLDYEAAKARATDLFEYMDALLAQRNYLTGSHPNIADLAAYTYVALAPEGDVPLEPYDHIRSWLSRIEGMPGFVPMQSTSAGLAA